MKEGIHPQYSEATVKCACGESFVTRSTKRGYLFKMPSVFHRPAKAGRFRRTC